MTEDVTRGLALLADEAESAPIDSHDVITRARALSRRRRSMATAFAAVVAIGAAAVTLQADQSRDAPATQPEPPSKRLTAQLAAALPELIPDRWATRPAPPNPPTATNPSPNTFLCDSEAPTSQTQHLPPETPRTGPSGTWEANPSDTWGAGPSDLCYAMSWYQDTEGDIELELEINDDGAWFFNPCTEPVCNEWALPDGTRVRMDLDDAGVSPVGHLQQLEALRPDGTHLQVFLHWDNDRPGPMTVDELVKFADKFDY
jgi:hypothetical protein